MIVTLVLFQLVFAGFLFGVIWYQVKHPYKTPYKSKS